MLLLENNISGRDPDLYPFHYLLTETFYSPNNERKNWFLLSEHTIDKEYIVFSPKILLNNVKDLFSSLVCKYTNLLTL